MDKITKPWHKTWWGLGLIGCAAIILFFSAIIVFYFIGTVKNAKNNLQSAGIKLSGPTYQADNGQAYWFGSSKAKITIVEFGDFACSICRQAFSTARSISLAYKDQIKLVWRDYPIMQEYSSLLSLAGRCAGEQGLFWPMHDKLFQNQGVSTAEQLKILAGQIGADTGRFEQCLTKEKYLAQIQKDLTDGQSFGLTGTPTYFINGHKIEGNIPYETFVKIIEELKK